ncbi:peptidoglycan bridge formation glycyltransferase FemA/FemB family protein [Patescibacteria group bacterium]|nr:peptidoglycan bridge formation glycyltransferase FemA/FemB family protein [Patescibacteria group bacterium]MBU1472791.1 peptidoglycan bridge formation glycyltransferase FemA/FemB family protein [Patescibacteria group bacterium]MBU2459734.1 peptidoglycan bridge formation glycyltransferase FemA/FemB family protein [Patescibacteria group bacterium]MBU2544410.1 peptidoglycan bridge formation glycyltransferase FemA/FemB family protein [Patescibacteria group bacterium]
MSLHIKPMTDQDVWDDFIIRHSPGAVFQSWLWGEVQKRMGNTVWRWGVFDDGRLEGVYQVVKAQARRGVFLHVRHGPVIASDRTHYSAVTRHLKELAIQVKAVFVRMSPRIADSPNNRRLMEHYGMRPAPIHAMDAERSWVLDLDVSEDKLLSGMRKTTRYEIRRAQKLGVTIRKSTKLQDIELFLSLYSQTSKRHGFVPHEGILEEFEVFAKQNQAILINAWYEQKLLASSVILFFGGQAIYHHGASLPTKIPASYLVQWEAIREAKKRGMQVYNFWGIAPPNTIRHPWQGITLFKKGFGGRENISLHAYDYPLSRMYWFSWMIDYWRKIQKGYS